MNGLRFQHFLTDHNLTMEFLTTVSPFTENTLPLGFFVASDKTADVFLSVARLPLSHETVSIWPFGPLYSFPMDPNNV